jgi:hypothetical protein
MQTTESSQFADQTPEAPNLIAAKRGHKPANGRWWRRTIRRGLEGQSLAEFAISLPFLIFLMLALTELGFLIRDHLAVNNAVREGVRAATQAGDYSPQWALYDKRVSPGNDGDTVMTANVSTALGDVLDHAYLLMSYRADSSDPISSGIAAGSFGITRKVDERWGVVYIPNGPDDTTLDPNIGNVNVWKKNLGDNQEPLYGYTATVPMQRIYQQITNTLMVTVTGKVQTFDSKGAVVKPEPVRTVSVPYVRKGWLPGVMDGTIYTYTVTLPFKFATDGTTQIVGFDKDPQNLTALGNGVMAVGPTDTGGYGPIPYSNQLLVYRSTQPCPKTDPAIYTGSSYFYRGHAVVGTIPASGTPFCGSNSPQYHFSPFDTGIASASAPYSAGLTNADAWERSFHNDPWYPIWRLPGGVCDVPQPSTKPGSPYYYNASGRTPHWLGVRVDYKHYWISGQWFGLATINLSDKAVKAMEPVPRPNADWKCGT